MLKWSYTYENIEDFLLDAYKVIKFHDEDFSEDKSYEAHSDYKKVGNYMSFSEKAHVFTGKLNSLIEIKFCLKNLDYNEIKLDILDTGFLITAKTDGNGVIHIIKVY